MKADIGFFAENALTAALAAGLSGDPAGMRKILARLTPRLSGDLADLCRRALAVQDFLKDNAADDGDAAKRPPRMDVIVNLHRYGSLTDAELAAALELRGVAALASGGGVRAVDPSKPVVDGGTACWQGGAPAGAEVLIDAAAAEKLALWLAEIQSGVPVVGKRGKLTALRLVWRVVVDNAPVSEIDRELGCRRGMSVTTLQGALAVYAKIAS